MSLLTVENLTLAAGGKTLVDRLSFTLQAQETLAIVGPSGAGKTLTALALLNLLPPGIQQIAGTITLDGSELSTADKARLRHLRGGTAGLILQDPNTSLNPLQRVHTQLAESHRLHGHKTSRENLLTHLKQAGFDNPSRILNAFPHQLSGGQRQRVMLAIALANDPQLLIADEPTSSLDSESQSEFFQRLTAIRRQRNLALLLISHDLNLVRRQADHILILEHGRIVESGPAAAIFIAPRYQQTQTTLAAGIFPAPPPGTLGGAILQVQNLTVEHPVLTGPLRLKTGNHRILDNISFELRAGETLGLVGASGAGKSTIALALLNLVKYQGAITLNGKSIGQLSRRQAGAARQIVFQNPFSSLSPRLTVAEIITEGLTIHAPNLTPLQLQEKRRAALTEVGLPNTIATRFPHQLSGGEAQRAAIARALIIRPQFLILDEPTSGLDTAIQADILRLLQRLQQTHSLAYLFISHDLAVMRAIAHRVIILQNGRIIETGDAQTMLSHQRTAYAETLLNQAEPI
jgi:microcin C transport system ATP-binding protein